MDEIKEAILKGHDLVLEFFSPFLGKTIKYRPITTWELDDAMISSLSGLASKQVMEVVMNLNLGLIGLGDKVSIDPKDYAELLAFRRSIDYFICYHAMKDFSDITVDDLRNSSIEIHELANEVRKASVSNPKTFSGFLESSSGKLLASVVYKLHVPLVDSAWKMTPLQLKFLGEAPKLLDDQGIKEINECEHEYTTEELKKNPDAVLRKFFDERYYNRPAGRSARPVG